MYAIRLFKITRHFCKQFIACNAHIYRKSQSVANDVFDFICQCNRIRICCARAGHIQKTFVNGKLFQSRCISAANRKKCLRILLIQGKIRRSNDQLRTLSQCRSHWFSRANAKPFCWNRFCQDNTGTLFRISANTGRNQPQIFFSFFEASC